MTSSSAHALDAASGLTRHKYPWKWNLSNLDRVKKHGKTVFSCFSCGGGSTMGYKLAGYNVLGNNEIDPKINAVYLKNHHPKYNFNMDIRKLITQPELPEELFSLDVLDGSPPCSTFSLMGGREKFWNKKKKFKEGQSEQVLDDLFFEFLNLADRLKPKVIIAENVKGLIMGNAKGYVNQILNTLKDIGYSTQLFLLNASEMGVPQQRERVFFIANRMGCPKLSINVFEPPILFGKIRSEHGKPINQTSMQARRLQNRKIGDADLGDISKRYTGKDTSFGNGLSYDGRVAPTLTTKERYRFIDGEGYSIDDYRAVSTFPQDYDFGSQSASFICGMSVPPVMMAHVASAVYEQWLKR